MTETRYLQIAGRTQQSLIEAARDLNHVAGLTHNFYRYPARFSPAFARAAICAFTRQGDLVLDPYVGGGTSLVEACALGRDAIGIDISKLAEFVSSVKTTIFADHQLDELRRWASVLPTLINVRRTATYFSDYAERGYYRHLEDAPRWRLRKAIEQGIESAMRLDAGMMESFGRCVILRTAQWALDGRKVLPSLHDFRTRLASNADSMIQGADELRTTVERRSGQASIRVINRTTIGLEDDAIVSAHPAPKLVVTSPPYPGVHVLYHRWQVDGRKESAAPFWIANKLDGAASSYYTMGDRQHPNLATYFANVEASMSSVAKICDEDTIIVQMMAFSEPDWQLQRYLTSMQDAGLSEFFLPDLRGKGDGRLWRTVPNRRWYSDQRGNTPGSREVVLFLHRTDER